MANHHLRPSPPAAPTTSTLSPIEMRRPACFETMFVPKKTECFHDFCLVAQPSASPDLLMQQCTQGEVLTRVSLIPHLDQLVMVPHLAPHPVVLVSQAAYPRHKEQALDSGIGGPRQGK